MAEPSRKEIREILLQLLRGAVAREEAGSWAMQWVAGDDDVTDAVVWKSLQHLAGVDLQVSPGEYMHSEIDIHIWIDELEHAEDE